MQSSSNDLRDRTSICFNKEGPDRGLSIFVTHSPYSFIWYWFWPQIPSDIGDDTVAINIDVLLPRVNSKIETFTTCLPMFSQNFGDLRQYLSFGQFSLQGSHRLIHSTVCDHLNVHMKCEDNWITLFQFLQASQILVTNVLSSIQGSFNVTQSLSLESMRGYLQQRKNIFLVSYFFF